MKLQGPILIATSARCYSDSSTVECPTGSGPFVPLGAVADELAARLIQVFVRDETTGRRAVLGDNEFFQTDQHWRDCVPFHEFFHGDSGAGLGAGHQTGWTALVALLLQHRGQLCLERLRAQDTDRASEVHERRRTDDSDRATVVQAIDEGKVA